MKPAKLWLQVFTAGFVVIVALLIVTLYTPVAYGDLSRIGQVSEHEFGWQREPPPVERQYLRASRVTEADVLVIGDSFSMTYRWQSALTRQGLRVTTIYWGQFGVEALCDDFDEWLDKAGFRGKLVVIESIERLLRERLENTQKCAKMEKPFESKIEPFYESPEHVPGFALNWKAKLMAGYITYENTREAKESDGATLAGKGTWVRPVVDGCDMFSNRLCDKALFFKDDDDNGELTVENITQMRAFNKAHPARSIIWMVIPNKTTTYVQLDHSKDFVTAFAQSGLGPDLFTFAKEQKTKIRDFYFPNDTHLSMYGQLAVGDVMLEAVRKIIPQPPAKPS
jgi:hypothetical protein